MIWILKCNSKNRWMASSLEDLFSFIPVHVPFKSVSSWEYSYLYCSGCSLLMGVQLPILFRLQSHHGSTITYIVQVAVSSWEYSYLYCSGCSLIMGVQLPILFRLQSPHGSTVTYIVQVAVSSWEYSYLYCPGCSLLMEKNYSTCLDSLTSLDSLA